MAEEVQPKFIFIWQVRYIPSDVPAWHGPLAAMPRDYYFLNKDELDRFMKGKKRFHFKVSKTLSLVHDDVYFPFPEQYVFSDGNTRVQYKS